MRKDKNLFILIVLLFNLIALTGFTQESKIRIFDVSGIKIDQLMINTIRSDFGPAVVGDTLYFTSYSDKILGKPDKKLRENAFYDLFRSRIDKEGNPITPREPVPEFITQYHDGPVSYCKATGELFVTQSDNAAANMKPKIHKKDTIRLRIVIAKQIAGRWTSKLNFPYNNPKYSVGHPAISLTGDTLVFSSDQPGGYGKTDLYYSVRENGKWSVPVNMGPKINTAGKEEFSSIVHSSNGQCFLVFASTGRPGFGGLDLYYTRFPYNGEEIVHFGAPINTPDDDFDMVVPDGADFGYLASNRPGTGSDDIYRFTFKKLMEPNVPKSVAKSLMPVRELYVYNSRTRKPILDTKITDCDSALYLTGKGGKAMLADSTAKDCEVVAQKFGFGQVRKLLIAKLMNKGEINRDTVWLDPVIGKISLLNIYYDLNKSNILPEAALELDKLIGFMKENPDLKVQLSSHTDSRGNDAYNMRLSERRAQSAVQYIVSHGISADRITGKGYGETQLLNKCVNCTPQEHRQNRRTEIYIPEVGKSMDVKQTEGDQSGVPDKKYNSLASLKQGKSVTEKSPGAVPIPSNSRPVPGNTGRVDTLINKGSPPKTAQKVSKEKPDKGKTALHQPVTNIGKAVTGNINSAAVNNETTKLLQASSVVRESKEDGKQSRMYYLIISSFQQKSNADRFLSKLQNRGMQVRLILADPYFRIGIPFNTYKEAKLTKSQIDHEFEGCWIM